MNYWKFSAILTFFLILGLTGAVSAADLAVSGSILPAAPVIDFTGTPTSGTSPLTVAFTVTNTGGTVDTWSWDFGDSGTSAEQNPSHQYTTAGTYTVKLTATNAGGSDVEEKTGYITVNANANVDFIISGLVNTVPASAIFAKEPNAITVNNVKNLGTDTATNIVVKVYASDVDSGNTAISEITIPSLAGGAQTTVSRTDPTIRNLEGGTVTYTAKVDPDNLIAETNEANNNKTSAAKPLKYNGYKGKGLYWESGSNITTKLTYDLNGDIVYYTQPASAYMGVGWTTRTETWTGANLPIPVGATVEKAWLYISYNWDQTAGGYPNLVTTFNGNSLTLGTPYRDWSNFGTYVDYEYGLYPAYDVTSMFTVNGDNTLVTTPGNGGTDNQVALYPSTLVVIYRDSSETRKQIFINEECDELGVSPSSYGTTLEEAIAYAPFTGMTIDTTNVQSAILHSFAGSAGPSEGNLLFNGVTVATNAWQGSSSTASAQSFDVKTYLTANGNEAGIQGTTSGGMDALMQILVVEYTAAAPVAAFSTSATNGLAPVSASFMDASTNTPTSWLWEYRLADNGAWTQFSTSQNPIFDFTTAGTYDVRLTATNAGGSGTVTKTHVLATATETDYLATIKSGTVSGDLFVDSVSPWGDMGGSTFTQSYTLPASGSSIAWARVFVNDYSGSGTNNYPVLLTTEFDANGDGTFETLLGTETCDIQSGTNGYAYPLNDHVTKVYSDYEAWYDVTSLITATNPKVRVTAANVPGQTLYDGRIKGITLVVAYNDADADQVKYWVNHGNDWMTGSSSTGFDTSALASGWSAAEIRDVAFSSVDAGYTLNGAALTKIVLGTGAYYKYNSFDVTGSLLAGSANTFEYTNTGGSFKNCLAMLAVKFPAVTAPVAAFSGTPTSGDKPLTVAFTDASTNTPTSWAWTFGDGTTGTGQNPSHEYTTAGTYTVTLTATNSAGSDEETKNGYITVKEPSPVIDFSADDTTPPVGQTVTFTATNTGGTVNTWAWDFGDGSTSSEQSPNHEYTIPGTYTVTLTATGPDYSDTEIKTNYIQVDAAVIDVSVSPATIDFGTMSAGVDETGSTTVNVDVTAGTAWSVTAAASNSGYMGTGTLNLANPFQLSNDGTNFQAMTSTFVDFMNGSAGFDGSDTADVKQAIGTGDQPGDYSITLIFTGAFV